MLDSILTLMNDLLPRFQSDLWGILAFLFFLQVLPKGEEIRARICIVTVLYLLVVALMICLKVIWPVQLIIKFCMYVWMILFTTKVHPLASVYISCWLYDMIYLNFQINCLLNVNILRNTPIFAQFLLETVVCIILFFFFLQKILRPLFEENPIPTHPRQILLAFFTIAPFLIMSNAVYVYASQFAFTFIGLLCCFFIFVCCTIILYLERITAIHNEVTQDYRSMQRILAERGEQYELTKETIDIINRKCHDMKHQLTALQHISDNNAVTEYIDQVKQTVNIYDSVFHTGNQTLDTLLTEKSLLCQNRNITIKCIADAGKLDFMSPVDLYALFGNALDNAIEYVSTIEDPERRIISVQIREEQSMLYVSIENFFDHSLAFEDGLPISTKGNFYHHGFGTKSIRFTVEKYKGHMNISTHNHLFTLSILFPM